MIKELVDKEIEILSVIENSLSGVLSKFGFVRILQNGIVFGDETSSNKIFSIGDCRVNSCFTPAEKLGLSLNARIKGNHFEECLAEAITIVVSCLKEVNINNIRILVVSNKNAIPISEIKLDNMAEYLVVTNENAVDDKIISLANLLDDYGSIDFVFVESSLKNHQLDINEISVIGMYGEETNLVANVKIIEGKKTSIDFSIYIEEILKYICVNEKILSKKETYSLIGYDINGRKNAFTLANYFRNNGAVVEISLIGDDFDKNIEYCKKNNIGGLIYFSGENEVQIVNIKTGDVTRTNIDNLYS